MDNSRFIDLLSIVDDEDLASTTDEDSEDGNLTSKGRIPNAMCCVEEMSHGPLGWNNQCSDQLQQAVASCLRDELHGFKFSVTVADPKHADCPLVACSTGFLELTGYKLHDVLGRNCRFLLDGVPPEKVNDQTRFDSREFCQAARKGLDYDSSCQEVPLGELREALPAGYVLPKGEIVCVQTNAKISGELFKNMYYLRQVSLDESPYIVGVQTEVLEECEGANLEELAAKFKLVCGQMNNIEKVLSSIFWYSGSMRRRGS